MEKTFAQLQRHGSACLCSECKVAKGWNPSLRKDDGGDDSDGGSWITVNGAHIHLNSDGQADKGPAALVSRTANYGADFDHITARREPEQQGKAPTPGHFTDHAALTEMGFKPTGQRETGSRYRTSSILQNYEHPSGAKASVRHSGENGSVRTTLSGSSEMHERFANLTGTREGYMAHNSDESVPSGEMGRVTYSKL